MSVLAQLLFLVKAENTSHLDAAGIMGASLPSSGICASRIPWARIARFIFRYVRRVPRRPPGRHQSPGTPPADSCSAP